jgi:hypothetical protein
MKLRSIILILGRPDPTQTSFEEVHLILHKAATFSVRTEYRYLIVDVWALSMFIYDVDKYRLFEILSLLIVPVGLLRQWDEFREFWSKNKLISMGRPHFRLTVGLYRW